VRFTLSGLLALAGCIDLVPIAPPVEQPSLLTLSLRLSDSGTADGAVMVSLSAILDSGIDDQGRVRAVLDDTLRVFGRALPPANQPTVRRIVYSENLVLARHEVESSPFTVRMPAVGELPSHEVSVRWTLLSRGEPIPSTVSPGTDLILPVVYHGLPGAPIPLFRRWSVAVFLENGWSSFGGDGLAPSLISIPAQLLGEQGSTLLAVTNLNQTAEVAGLGGRSAVRLDLAQEVRWTVQVSDAAVADAPVARSSPDPGTVRES